VAPVIIYMDAERSKGSGLCSACVVARALIPRPKSTHERVRQRCRTRRFAGSPAASWVDVRVLMTALQMQMGVFGELDRHYERVDPATPSVAGFVGDGDRRPDRLGIRVHIPAANASFKAIGTANGGAAALRRGVVPWAGRRGWCRLRRHSGVPMNDDVGVRVSRAPQWWSYGSCRDGSTFACKVTLAWR